MKGVYIQQDVGVKYKIRVCKIRVLTPLLRTF